MIRIIFLLICFISLSSKAGQFSDKIKSFDEYVYQTFNDWNIPGLAVAIVNEKEIIYLKTLGETLISSGKKIDRNTIFRLCSLSKGMTAELIGKLEEEHKLRWDSKVASIIDNLALSSNSSQRSLTVEHLLSHSSGFSPQTFSKLIEKEYSYADLKTKLSNEDIFCKPGKCFAYQNFIYSLVGEVAEKVTKQNFDFLMKEKIFDPLKMLSTTCGAKGYLQNKNKALPHLLSSEGYYYIPKDHVSTYYTISPAAGVNSSIQDMSIWLRAQLGAFPKVISNEVITKVTTPYIRDTQTEDQYTKTSFYNDRIISAYYGMGWRILNYAHDKVIMHAGMLNGFTNIIAFLPMHNIGIVVLSNSVTPVPKILMGRFLDEYLELELIDYNKIALEKRNQ